MSLKEDLLTPSTESRSSIDEKRAAQDDYLDIEALGEDGSISPMSLDLQPSLFRQLENSTLFQTILSYPAPGSLKIKPTSWLDGVRGTAALGVYIFHALGCWASLVPAWHADENNNNLLQLPFIRTFFVSGGAAVSVFFGISGYVLTHKSLLWLHTSQAHLIRPSVYSSMFRRGFRLYLPPILTTFVEMLSTRFGYLPPLNFDFIPEQTLWLQIRDWVSSTNRLINPYYNFFPAIRGQVEHPKYDSVVWTIPVEYYGSFVCYGLLLLLPILPNYTSRMILLSLIAAPSMMLGSWNTFCFVSGMIIASSNIRSTATPFSSTPQPPKRILWTTIFMISFYIAGFPSQVYPEARTSPMPGFETLRSLTPSLPMTDLSRIPWSISGILILASISNLPSLKSIFETNLAQYLGKISFMLYLIHEFCMVIFGLGVKGWMIRSAGVLEGSGTAWYWILCVSWFVGFSGVVFSLAAVLERSVDRWCVNFARGVEGVVLGGYKKVRGR